MAVVALLLLSSLIMFLPQKASAASWTETSDTDFGDGNFLTGTGFETELNDVGVGAYVQNKRDVGNWIERFPATNPGERKGFGFTNDSSGSRIVLFGGVDGSSSARNDTWEYNYGTNQWMQICKDDTPACAPPRRFGPSMAYDNNSKVVVLYGGYAADFITELTDTWEYHVNNNTWVNRTSMTMPRSLGYHSMVYDPVTKQVILVGRGVLEMEVWAYSAATHLWQRKASMGLTMRSGFALAYNYQAGHKRVVLFGGAYGMSLYDDTWEYDTQMNIWSQMSVDGKPTPRAGAAMTYVFRTSVQGILIWGGSIDSNLTWKYTWQGSPPMPNWFLVLTPNIPSPLRKNHGLAYDSGHDALIMYGGSDFSGSTLNDTWSIEFGFRLEGKYVSSMFNTYQTTTHWDSIFWNQTPANVPPGTLMRFQLNVSNACDPAATPFWSPYYTAPGQSIDVGGFKCIMYLVDMISYTSSVAPKLEDVSITYTITELPPTVSSVSPTMFNVRYNSPVLINFSKPMGTSNVWVSIVPNVTFSTPWNWYEGDTKVRITHTILFLSGQKYDVCVWGTDKSGKTLDYPGGKYCWSFTTIAPAPYIVSTLPVQGQTNVRVTYVIIVQFSAAMNTGTCWQYATISPFIALEWWWDSSAKYLTGYHNTTDFQQMTTYTVEIPIGDPARPCENKAGILLTVGPPPSIPDPWYFTTESINPYIVETDPVNGLPRIPVNKAVNVTFNRDMQVDSLSYAFKDLTTGLNWSGSFTATWTSGNVVSLAHAQYFDSCRPYEMKVWALDLAGLALINNPMSPNPWRFQTAGPRPNGCPPYMLDTNPSDGDTEVPLDRNIMIVWWSDAGMDRSSMRYTVKDQYGEQFTAFTEFWLGMGLDAVELRHNALPFNRCVTYTVTILAAKDISGRDFIPGLAENPFNFSTLSSGCHPLLIWAQPANNTKDVPLDQDIILKFSLPINTSTLSFFMLPDAEPYDYSWSENDTNVTITHSAFVPCQAYKASISALDKNGNPLVPGPTPSLWTFTAVCVEGPNITSTSPVDRQKDVPWTSRIYVNFSEPMDTAVFNFTLTPSAGNLSYTWANADMTMVIEHSAPYADCVFYTARVRTAMNKIGQGLVAGPMPNPWRYQAKCVPPYIVSTSPPDWATGVSIGETIIVVFSEPVLPGDLVFDVSGPGGVLFSAFWPNNRTVKLSHTAPFGICTRYMAWVREEYDLSYHGLVPGPVPNPWNFTIDCRFPIRGLQVHRLPPNDVSLTWAISPEATHYKVFHSNNRMAPWPWVEIADVTTNSVRIAGHLSDMQDHFYIVRGYNLTQESINSTMGVLWHMSVTPNTGKTSALWFSLPYNTIYRRASDIASELGPANVSVVGKWNPARQQLILYYYLHGQWRGQDFSIMPGDGLMIGIVSAFDWAINGTDKAAPLTFTFRPTMRTNLYWVGLPYTGGIRTASELVLTLEGGLGPGNDTKIVRMGKWDYAGQTSFVYSYGVGGWSGIDFSIDPADGIWVEIVSSFVWTPELVTPEVP